MDNQSLDNRIKKMESDLFRLGTEPEKFEFTGLHSGSTPGQAVSVVPGPGKSELLQQIEYAYKRMKETKHIPHMNPIADYIEMGKRVHTLPDLIRSTKALVDSEGGDYYKGVANGLICAWNIIMDEECKFVSVDSSVGSKNVEICFQYLNGDRDHLTIPAPLTQSEGYQRMYELDL